ncbi:MalY/PatB family protein [Humidisolicoccus flavus]|uniref:MalY/PatB family protein n=1 Tax=Humidisolicoccus flavus TaxID=3111414 RepID=UPI00324CC205
MASAPHDSDPFETVSLAQLRERSSIKWNHFGPDVLPLWVAEMDTVPDPAIAAAVAEAFSRGDTGYFAGTALFDAYSDFAAERWGFEGAGSLSSIAVADVMTGVYEVIRVLTAPGERVIVTSPVYPPFFGFIEHAERVPVEVPLTSGGRLDLEALDAAFAEARADGQGAAMLLCNPHNPTGTVHSRSELQALAVLAKVHGVRVISDEIHSPLVYDAASFTPWLSIDDAGFAVFSASKAWNLAGMRIALVMAGAEATPDLERIPEVVHHGAHLLAGVAHVAALTHARGWLDRTIAALEQRRDLLAELLREHAPSVGYRIPEATFLGWLDFSRTPLAQFDAPVRPGLVTLSVGPAAEIAREAKVGLSAGEAFGTGGANHVRLNFACSREVLTAAIRQIGALLESMEQHPSATTEPSTSPE